VSYSDRRCAICNKNVDILGDISLEHVCGSCISEGRSMELERVTVHRHYHLIKPMHVIPVISALAIIVMTCLTLAGVV